MGQPREKESREVYNKDFVLTVTLACRLESFPASRLYLPLLFSPRLCDLKPSHLSL